MALRAALVKVYYDTEWLNEQAIVEEIETWEGVEEVQVLQNARAD